MSNSPKILLLRLLRKIGFLKKRRLKLNLAINNSRFKVPIINEVGFNNHNMDEFWMSDLFRLLRLAKNCTLIDLGANVGQTLLKWKSIYPESHYIGVEPLPAAVDYLQHLISINHFPNSTVHGKAISENEGHATLHLHFDDNTDRSASLNQTIFDTATTINVETLSFDSLIQLIPLSCHNNIVFKIDIEGSEKELLLNNSELIKKLNATVIVELLETSWDLNSWKKMIAKYQGNGYGVYEIIKFKNQLTGFNKIDNYPFPRAAKFIDLIILSDSQFKNLKSE